MKTIEKIKSKLSGMPKMSKQCKRSLILALSLVIICAAVFLNWRLGAGDGSIEGIVAANGDGDTARNIGDSVEVDTKPSEKEAEDDYFSTSIINRERVREEAIATLREIAESDEAQADTKKDALDRMTSLAEDMTGEVNIENLVMAKGFANCVAVINGDSVDVIVRSDGLMPSEVAQIRDIVIEQTGAEAQNIRIIEKQ